ADVVADRAALAENEAAVDDHRGDAHRVQRLVFIGRESIVRPPLVALERVVDAQFLAQPDDALGLRNPQVMNCQHVGRAPVCWRTLIHGRRSRKRISAPAECPLPTQRGHSCPSSATPIVAQRFSPWSKSSLCKAGRGLFGSCFGGSLIGTRLQKKPYAL